MPAAALVNSALLAAGAVAIALPLGTLLAFALARFDVPGRRLVVVLLGGLLFVPLYVVLAGWDAALGKLGWLSLAQGTMAEPLLAGMRGAIVIHGVAAIPWVAAIVGIGVMQVDPAQEEAALLDGPPSLVLWRVTLPQVRPLIVAAAIWTAVCATAEMTVTNIYLVDPRAWTLTERFYMAIASRQWDDAIRGALPAMALVPAVAAGALWIVARLTNRRRVHSAAREIVFPAGRWRPALTLAVWLVCLVLMAVPIGSLIVKAGFVVHRQGDVRVAGWSAAAFAGQVAAAPVRFQRELFATHAVAAGAASLAVFIGALLAWRARRSPAYSRLTTAIVALALAVPGPLVGAALIQLFNHDLPPRLPLGGGEFKSWLLVLYDQTVLAPVIAQAIKALPVATLLLWHSLATLSDDVLEAAALDGLSPRQVFWQIALPVRWRALAAAWIAALAIAAGDLAWAHLVTPPGLDLLQRRVFGLLHSGVEEQVAAVSLVVVAAYAGLAVVALWLVRPQRRTAMHHCDAR